MRVTRVRHVGPNRLFWSAGRGTGDYYTGVELWLDQKDAVRRCTFTRGKYGKEKVNAEESYSREEYQEILQAEGELLALDKGAGARELVQEALVRLRMAYAIMEEGEGQRG
jgi:uncharacterized protein YllA (UPF0747 family)